MENKNNTALKIFLFGCGGIVSLAVIIVAGFVVFLISVPEGGVKVGGAVDPYAVKYLNDRNMLEPGEKVLAYYDATLTMDGTESAILTDKRLIQHMHGGTTALRLAEIEDIRHRKESLIGDIIEAEDSNGVMLKIEIAPLNQGETFNNALMSAWRAARQTPPEVGA